MPERFESLKKDFARLETDFRAMANSIPQLAWMADGEGSIFWYNQRWFDYTGSSIEEMAGWGWKAAHHPDHVERVEACIRQAFTTGLPWEDLFPLRAHDGSYRWFLSRAQPMRDETGKVVRWFGTNTDITEQKRTEERQGRLMREIDHRARNALTVAQSIVNLSQGETVEVYKAAVQGRIDALARTHSLLAASHWDGADLATIVHDEVKAFRDASADSVRFEGPAVQLQPAHAQSLGLILHELAMNASRYGALSHSGGRLDVSWAETEGRVTVEWREHGGSGVAEPDRKGFGTGLLERLIADFDGTLLREWREDGLSVHISMHTGGAPSASEPSAAPPSAPVARKLSARRILVVEDEPMTALDLEMRLSDAGYEVMGPAASLRAAERELDLGLPDIALLDSNLGGVKSYALAEHLVANGVPVVFCTGYEELDDLPDCLIDCPIVSKPFRDSVLMAALDSAAQRVSA